MPVLGPAGDVDGIRKKEDHNYEIVKRFKCKNMITSTTMCGHVTANPVQCRICGAMRK